MHHRLALAISPALALLALGASSARADPDATKIALPVQRATLANGLEVVLHEDHRTPIVAVNLWYHVGSKDETAGRYGFAHLFEHVMFQGSKHVAEDTYFRYLERAGASNINGSTDSDRTNYFEVVPRNRLGLALWLESDRMGFLLDHVDQQTFATQREVVKNERRQNYENAPYGLVAKYVEETLFPPSHPYHHLTIGSPEDLDAATLDDVKQFFRTWYVPRNATLVIAGDIDETSTLALVDKYFGSIPNGAPPQPALAVPEVELAGETRLEIESGAELGRVQISWIAPKYFAPGDSDLDLLGRVLTATKSSRLYKRLVYDDQIAQDVSAYQGSRQLVSEFEIVATAKPAHTPEELLAAIDQELAKVQGSGVDDAELSRARTAFVAAETFGLEGATASSVRDAAVRWLPAGKRVVAFVRPVKGAPLAGRLVSKTP